MLSYTTYQRRTVLLSKKITTCITEGFSHSPPSQTRCTSLLRPCESAASIIPVSVGRLPFQPAGRSTTFCPVMDQLTPMDEARPFCAIRTVLHVGRRVGKYDVVSCWMSCTSVYINRLPTPEMLPLYFIPFHSTPLSSTRTCQRIPSSYTNTRKPN